MAYGEFKDLPRRRKVLGDKAFNITKNPKYDGYQGGLTLTVHNFFRLKICYCFHSHMGWNQF